MGQQQVNQANIDEEGIRFLETMYPEILEKIPKLNNQEMIQLLESCAKTLLMIDTAIETLVKKNHDDGGQVLRGLNQQIDEQLSFFGVEK